MVVITEIEGFVLVVTPCSLVDVLEEHNVYIFRFYICRVRNLFGLVDTSQGRCRLRPIEQFRKK
jgi:hypothetical protein